MTHAADGPIRAIGEPDLDAVVDMIGDLARFQCANQEVELSPNQLRAALFAAKPALYGVVAIWNGEIAGFALWYISFSTWDGEHGIHLEDLYVREVYRRRGVGRRLMTYLAEECVRRGFSRLEWSVLKSNANAQRFYKDLHSEPQDDWVKWRLSRDPLRKLAEGGI